MDSLEAALGEEAAVETEEIPVETVEAKGETEVESSETVEEAVVEPPSTSEETTIPITAFHGVRDELKTLKDEFKTYQTEHPVEKPEPTSVFDDEPTARTEMRNEILGEVNNTLFSHGLNSAYREFDNAELVDTAVEWAKSEAVTSPFLAKQFDGVSLMDLPRKAVEVYQLEQKRTEMEDPAKHDAKVAEKAVADYIAGQNTTEEERAALRASIPKTLVGETSKGGIQSTEWAGPTKLESVIGR